MKFNVLTSLICMGSLSAMASADLYGLSSDTPGTVYSIDSATGAATPVVTLSGSVFTSIVGFAFLGGTAYATDVFTSGFSFGSIDLTTGAFTTLSNQDGSANWWALAPKESAGVMYTMDNDAGGTLKTVDSAGATTSIGVTGIGMYGLAYDPLNDTLYGTDADNLYTIDQTTAVATLVGSLGGSGGGGYNDLAYDPSTDTLYMNGDTSLYTVDRTTGATTLVGANGQGSIPIDGLAYMAPVPEPATMSALGLGVLALLRRRRRS